MVHTLAPWTSKWRMARIFGNIDDAELAARLGSPSLRDRRGNVQYTDMFEGSEVKWDTSTTGTGAAVDLSNAESFFGDQSIRLTSGDATGNKTYIERSFPLSPDARMGLEFMYLLSDVDTLVYIQFDIYDGTTKYPLRITIDEIQNLMAALISGGSDYTFESDPTNYIGEHCWHNVKLVCDLSTGKYVRFTLDNVEYDLSSYSINSSASATYPHMYVRLTLETYENQSNKLYFDGVMLTINEP